MTQSPRTQSEDRPEDRPIPELNEGWERVDLGVYARMSLDAFEYLQKAVVTLSAQISRFGVFWWVRCLQLWVLLHILDYSRSVLSDFMRLPKIVMADDDDTDDDETTEWEDRN